MGVAVICGIYACVYFVRMVCEVCGIIVGSPGCGVKFPNWDLWYGGNSGVPRLELCVIRGYGMVVVGW